MKNMQFEFTHRLQTTEILSDIPKFENKYQSKTFKKFQRHCGYINIKLHLENYRLHRNISSILVKFRLYLEILPTWKMPPYILVYRLYLWEYSYTLGNITLDLMNIAYIQIIWYRSWGILYRSWEILHRSWKYCVDLGNIDQI